MNEVSTLRLYVLRATYLLLIVGLGAEIWPLLLRSGDVEHMRGVVRAMLGAVSLVAVLGIRYPLKMLPLLLFELTWKAIWVALIGFPLWSTNRLDAATGETWFACLMGLVIFPIAIPWGYVIRNYAIQPGDRWRIKRASSVESSDARELHLGNAKVI
jgi:hypothetical protein